MIKGKVYLILSAIILMAAIQVQGYDSQDPCFELGNTDCGRLLE